METEKIAWVIMRLSIGWIFLWAFLDKLFGLGFTTPADKSWLAGTSPTLGFLKFGTTGPLAGLFQVMAGNVIVDLFFMAGLLGIGMALILGIGMRVAAASGAVLMILMWLAVLPKEHNPFMDEHIIYSAALILMNHNKAGEYFGLGRWWNSLSFVKKNKWLQ